MTILQLLLFAATLASVFARGRDYRTIRTVMIHDQAHLQPEDLSSATRTMASVFRRSGIDFSVISGSPDGPDAQIVDFRACIAASPRHSGSVPIRLRIIASAPPGFSPATLGFALPCARYGANATVFADRVMRVSCDLSVPFPTALGYALAHELGHLLLQSDEHTPTGIMRAVWSRSDWRTLATFGMEFDANQSEVLRHIW